MRGAIPKLGDAVDVVMSQLAAALPGKIVDVITVGFVNVELDDYPGKVQTNVQFCESAPKYWNGRYCLPAVPSMVTDTSQETEVVTEPPTWDEPDGDDNDDNEVDT